MAGCSGNVFLDRGGGRRVMIQHCADKLGQALALRCIVGPRRGQKRKNPISLKS